jgi:hypothetical protein
MSTEAAGRKRRLIIRMVSGYLSLCLWVFLSQATFQATIFSSEQTFNGPSTGVIQVGASANSIFVRQGNAHDTRTITGNTINSTAVSKTFALIRGYSQEDNVVMSSTSV